MKPGAAEFRPATFGHKGQVYDGWEMRRRRGLRPDSRDSVIVRLAVPGIVRGVVVDTAWFTGNYPPQISVEAATTPDTAFWCPTTVRSPTPASTSTPMAGWRACGCSAASLPMASNTFGKSGKPALDRDA